MAERRALVPVETEPELQARVKERMPVWVREKEGKR